MRSPCWWEGPSEALLEGDTPVIEAVRAIDSPVIFLDPGESPKHSPGLASAGAPVGEGRFRVTSRGRMEWQSASPGPQFQPVRGFVPALQPGGLGDAGFLADYGIRFPYLGGSMAHGISSPDMVEAFGKAGMLGFVGSAGQSPTWVEGVIDRFQSSPERFPHGFNLIHSPNEPLLENALVDLYLRRGVRLLEASAFLAITLPLVRFRLSGIRRGPDGRVVAPNRIVAKVSRVEVATRFLSPAPEKLVQELVARGELTPEQAQMATEIPIAQDLTAEADSGGHTDNRPAVCLVPTFLALRDRLQAQFRYPFPLRIGAAGGIATPQAAAAAFVMGAAYIMGGSVHQSCLESGTSEFVREILAQAGQADVAMAPAGDMFEMGVNVQVLKRGTMFAMRAKKLYELYTSHQRLEDLSPADRDNLEKNLFKAPLVQIWDQTRKYFLERDPIQVQRAERDPKHLMALVFRWYLGQSARWSIAGDPARRIDFQVWCGPAMGSFNEWVKGSHLEPPTGRRVAEVAMSILHGAAVVVRASLLRAQGVVLPPACFDVRPLAREALRQLIEKRP